MATVSRNPGKIISDNPDGTVIEWANLHQATVDWWQSALGDRIPPDWPILPVFVEEYFREVLQPALSELKDR